ncbi:phosphatase PAP2 family protein [Mucilaginibacter sp. CSA2-8R]|uniref:phosphatase PAP2 family protein n=1 Tax=Mucilaginibacter sp. CSA2-8R TaxID=3141542 RepID=UPI00315DA029
MNRVGYLTTFASIIFVLLFLPAQAQYVQAFAPRHLDDRIMMNLADSRTPAKTDFYYTMSKTNLYGNALVPAGLLVGGLIDNNKEMRQNALYVASSSVISYGLVLLVKKLVKRPRPFRGNFRVIPVYIAGDYSFPSGHASSSISTATALSIAYPKWYVMAPAFLWAGSVTYSRMYLGLHYPSDVTVGALAGAGTAVYFNTIRKRMQ